MSDLLYTVFTDIVPEYEEEFNIWQEQEHCPLLLTCTGYHSVTRYACMDIPYLYANFWHIEDKSCFDSPERAQKASHTPWGKKLSPYRYRHIDFFQQDGGIDQAPPAAEIDERLTFLVMDGFSSEDDCKRKLTEQYREAIQTLRFYEKLLDVKIYHVYEGLVQPDKRLHTAENYILYYLSCSEEELNHDFLPLLAEKTAFSSSFIERLRCRCVSQWQPKR